MTYTFRLTFGISKSNRIGHDGPELVLRETQAGRIAIRSRTADKMIREEDRFILRGEGYSTENEARKDGERWISALAMGLVAELAPPDFEGRRPRGQSGQPLLDQLNAEAGGAWKLYSDQTGLLVVPEDPPPIWHRLEATAEWFRNASAMAATIRRAYDEGLRPDDRTMLAIELYSAAEMAADADTRFLTLMIAVEAMIEVGQRPKTQVAVLNALCEDLSKTADIDLADRREICEALAGLRRESISAAGRHLAATLAPRLYDNKSAVDFFRYAYKIRSQLVHGNVGKRRPTIEQVHALQGPMIWFVRDLILARGGADWPHPLDIAPG